MIIRILIIFFIAGAYVPFLQAQVNLTLKRPIGRQVYIPDLYQINIINTGNELPVHLRLEVKEAKDGMVGIIWSRAFTLKNGNSNF